MAPTAVLHKLTTITAMITTINNSLSADIANTIVVNSASSFGTFQDTAVGSSDLTIHTIVPPNISAEPYRKAMIAILFFRRILSLSSSPSVSISDLTATVAGYFTHSTGSAEREAERIVDSICHAFFHVDNLEGIVFLDSSGKPTLISDLTIALWTLYFSLFVLPSR